MAVVTATLSTVPQHYCFHYLASADWSSLPRVSLISFVVALYSQQVPERSQSFIHDCYLHQCGSSLGLVFLLSRADVSHTFPILCGRCCSLSHEAVGKGIRPNSPERASLCGACTMNVRAIVQGPFVTRTLVKVKISYIPFTVQRPDLLVDQYRQHTSNLFNISLTICKYLRPVQRSHRTEW